MKKLLVLAVALVVGVLAVATPVGAATIVCDSETSTAWEITESEFGATFVVGTAGDDVLVADQLGAEGPFVIFGLEGNDLICGSEGDDVIFGGEGNDVLWGNGGEDVLHGDEGNDDLDGGDGIDRIDGGPGDDSIWDVGPDATELDLTAEAIEPPGVEPSATPEVTPSPAPEVTPSPAPEVTPSPAPEVTPSPAPEVTPSPAPEVTPSPAPEVTPSPAPEVTPSPAPEVTPSPAPEVTPSPAPEVTPSPTSEVTPSPTPEVQSSATEADRRRGHPADKPGRGPRPTPTATPTPTPEPTPTPTPTPEPTPTPTPTPEPTPTATNSPVPTVEPTPDPTATPTVEPTPDPTATPTVEPTPTASATATPTVEPTSTPTPTPTPTPTVQPTPDPAPPPSNPSLPQTYGENLSLIQGASASADLRRAIVWDTGQQLNFALNEGNPFRYTPSAQLDYNDFVYHQGSQYGPDKGRGSTGGVFHATCQFSHLAYDDPIVFPGQPGRSHLHMFFGNTHANAFSTSNSILNEGGSTCSRGELNRTSYWIPAAIDGNDNVVVPDQFMVYYESYGAEWDTLAPFPAGLKLVQGQAMATSVQPNIPDYGTPSVRWKCGWYTTARLGGGGSAGPFTATPTNCSDSQYSHVELQIKWPFCWDGQNLDSANHQDHVVFPQAGPGYFVPGTCPASHPVTLPRITYRVHFKTQTITSPTSEILLSSDIQPGDGTLSPNGVSGHGDWFGGWNRDLLQGLVDRCILTGQECDEQHYGTPNGDQAAATRIESRVITPQQVTEYCPLRNQYDGNLYNVAYCRE